MAANPWAGFGAQAPYQTFSTRDRPAPGNMAAAGQSAGFGSLGASYGQGVGGGSYGNMAAAGPGRMSPEQQYGSGGYGQSASPYGQGPQVNSAMLNIAGFRPNWR